MATGTASSEVFENLRMELRRGCLIVAVLAQLRCEQYGYTLRKALADDGLAIDEGTLYPLLRRLETQGLLVSQWREEDNAIRAAVLPLVSYLGPAFAGLMTGSLVVERIFGLPGLGKFFVNSALQRDYTVVMGMVIFFATLILVLNLLADLLYAVLDPRVRLT
jgi:hypothetical protein